MDGQKAKETARVAGCVCHMQRGDDQFGTVCSAGHRGFEGRNRFFRQVLKRLLHFIDHDGQVFIVRVFGELCADPFFCGIAEQGLDGGIDIRELPFHVQQPDAVDGVVGQKVGDKENFFMNGVLAKDIPEIKKDPNVVFVKAIKEDVDGDDAQLLDESARKRKIEKDIKKLKAEYKKGKMPGIEYNRQLSYLVGLLKAETGAADLTMQRRRMRM